MLLPLKHFELFIIHADKLYPFVTEKITSLIEQNFISCNIGGFTRLGNSYKERSLSSVRLHLMFIKMQPMKYG